jgi:hypothetical protein
MDPVLIEVAGGATAVLAPFLASVAGGASAGLEEVGGDVGAGLVRRLWALLSGQPRVRRAAEDPDEDFEEDLAHAIRMVLQRDEELAEQVATLVDEVRAAAAGQPVAAGHALAERVRARHDLLVEGRAATARDAEAGWDMTVRATGGPDPKG